MSKGYYLVVGDKTTCGGIITEGDTTEAIFRKPTAREMDRVTCGVHPGMYVIVGHVGNDSLLGRKYAGTLDSFSSCPCKARFIPSNMTHWYEFKNAAPAPKPEPEQHAQAAKKTEKTLQDEPSREPVDAGFCVLPYGVVTESYEPWLFGKEPPAGTRELYRALNGSGKEYKAGSIMLLVDPDKQDSEQIAHLKAAKARVDAALAPLTHQEANFLHEHYATIANFSNFADKGIGLAADPIGKYFENIEKILREIQETYKNTYLTRGALIGQQFYVRRSQLFKELDSVLKVGFLNKGMKLGEYTKIKNALGLSTSSITHKWNETGVNDIDGYATHIERAAKYVKLMKYTGYVGIGFSAFHSINEVNEACSVGRESECTKKKYTEIGSFTLGTGAGVAGGALAVPLCVAIGVSTAGIGGLACTVIAGASLGYAGGSAGSALGEWGGEQLYETFGN